MQHFMRQIATLILTIIFFSSYAQEIGGKESNSREENDRILKNIREQENSRVAKIFSQNYMRFDGKILIVNENTIKYDDEVLLIYNTSNELKAIFEKGIFYPSIITGPVKKGLSRKEELDSTMKILRNDSLSISDFEEQNNFGGSPKEKKFEFLLFSKGRMNPTVYYIELTNDNATRETDLKTFINGARLSLVTKGSILI